MTWYSYAALGTPPNYIPPTTNKEDVKHTVQNYSIGMVEYLENIKLFTASSLFGKNELQIWSQMQASQLTSLTKDNNMNYAIYAKYDKAKKELLPLILAMNMPYDNSYKKILDTVKFTNKEVMAEEIYTILNRGEFI